MANGDILVEITGIKKDLCWIRKALEERCIAQIKDIDERVDALEAYTDENKWLIRVTSLAVTLTAAFMIGKILNLI